MTPQRVFSETWYLPLYWGECRLILAHIRLTITHSLSDHDDDVRAVAASCLLPVAGHLVQHLPESLDQVLVVLWQCLNDMKDDLNSSVGAVMDLLGMSLIKLFVWWLNLIAGKLVVFEKVIELLGKDDFG